jgi:GNAT superfamily N-acetyltransferase
MWWTAHLDGRLAGFCAARDDGAHVRWCSAYVLPAYRGRGVWTALADARDTGGGREVRVTCRPVLIGAYQSRGFVVTRRTKGYAHLLRAAR